MNAQLGGRIKLNSIELKNDDEKDTSHELCGRSLHAPSRDLSGRFYTLRHVTCLSVCYILRHVIQESFSCW
jgi:hypothetical protein